VRVFDAETVQFLESGCALIVGIVGPDGAPFAARGWGIDVVVEGDADLRLILDAGEAPLLEVLGAAGAIAVTAGDVRTLYTMQMKGHAVAIMPATDADRARARRYCDDFIAAVHGVDGTPNNLLERMVPLDYAVCMVKVDALFNQSPGPGAGAALERGEASA
jgi:hypothetical protein